MSGRQVRRLVSYTAETVLAFAASAANSVQYGKVLPLGAFATFLVVVTAPILFRADVRPVGANSTLKCYDSAGNYELCPARASASLSLINGPTTWPYQPASWATTARYQQESRTSADVDQAAHWRTGAPAARRSVTPRKRMALAICGRRLIPCVFSALRKEVTHLASAAAIEAGALPARGLKERYRPKDL
jgi:hypothetical protein